MEKDFEIVSGKSPLEQYFNANTVSDNAQRKLESVDLLAVPAKYVDGEFYYAQETIDFIKFCRQNDPDHSFDVLADGDVKLRSLHSFDIWLPIIWVAAEVLLPIAINVVSNFISDKLKGREKEEANVDLTMIVIRENEEKTIHYHGDAKTFKETFEKIDLNKM